MKFHFNIYCQLPLVICNEYADLNQLVIFYQLVAFRMFSYSKRRLYIGQGLAMMEKKRKKRLSIKHLVLVCRQ